MSKLPNIKTLLQALRGNRHANSSERDDLSGEMPPIDERITDTGYYSEISFRYHSAQIVCIMLLAVFLFVDIPHLNGYIRVGEGQFNRLRLRETVRRV